MAGLQAHQRQLKNIASWGTTPWSLESQQTRYLTDGIYRTRKEDPIEAFIQNTYFRIFWMRESWIPKVSKRWFVSSWKDLTVVSIRREILCCNGIIQTCDAFNIVITGMEECMDSWDVGKTLGRNHTKTKTGGETVKHRSTGPGRNSDGQTEKLSFCIEDQSLVVLVLSQSQKYKCYKGYSFFK